LRITPDLPTFTENSLHYYLFSAISSKVNWLIIGQSKSQIIMLESNLFSTLLPSHPDLLPIPQNIREKYNIPEIGPDDDGITEILLNDENIDWQAMQLIEECASNFRA
jgi:hypothetical protein